mgnify:CR=1 FL=1
MLLLYVRQGVENQFPRINKSKHILNEGIWDRDWSHKFVQKEYADTRREAALDPVLRGDLVLLKNTKTSGKLIANFESVPYTAQFKNGSKGCR